MRYVVGTFVAICVLSAQQPPPAAGPKPLGWRPVIKRLNDCVAKLPPEQSAEARIPLNWMVALFENADKPMPPSYRESLEQDAALCEAALKDTASKQIFGDLVDDLRQKGRDCVQYGWYRNVRVQVDVLRAGKSDPGWEIYYLWIPGRNLTNVQKVRYKALSPSEEALPPGLYSFQARKGTATSEETRVAVVSKEVVVCQIPVQ